jgi:thymidylate synthase
VTSRTHVELPDLRNGYVSLLVWLTRHGDRVASRDGWTTELTGVTLEFPDPTGVMLPIGVNRKINTRLAAVEALQLISGTADVDLLTRASPSYRDVLVDPTNVEYGLYGRRLGRQLPDLYELLSNDLGTRRAVLSIWSGQDLTHDGDRPCTLTLQFLIRDDRLELIVNMRSQDVFLGVPFDLFMFTQLQLSLAYQLGVEVGRYVHHVGSLHLYERDRDAVGMLIMCSSDAPPPPDYPSGIRSPFPDVEHFYEVAQYLVEGTFDGDEAALNPWYVRQLARLGVDQRSDDL